MVNKKKVAIIGAGFTGLAAAWDLTKQGYAVEVFEASKLPGGLAAGFKEKNWQWAVEYHYHHIFKTDNSLISLLKEMDLQSKLFFKTVNTRSFFHGQAWSIDSPISLLKFAPLSILTRFRVGAVIAAMKLLPNGSFLEKYTAKDFLVKTMGQKAWEVLWEPLFVGKFATEAEKINMAWFWARIAARSQQLGYYRGGFFGLAEDMVEKLKAKGVTFHFNQPIQKIVDDKSKVKLVLANNKQLFFSKVLATVPYPILSKIYQLEKNNLTGLAARTLVLELDAPFFSDQTYWLSIHEKNWPFLAVVEHTNLVNRAHYGGKNMVYVGKYLSRESEFYKLSLDKVLEKYAPYLEQLSPGWESHVTNKWLFSADFAQPLVYQNHSQSLPKVELLKNKLYWLSMQHVYPWDRGINYAVKFGRSITNYLRNE